MRAHAARALIVAVIAGTFVLAITRGAFSESPHNQLAGATTVPAQVSTAASSSGLTVSWMSTDSPTTVRPGQPARGKFWVTNPTRTAVPVTIAPATAVPGNDGELGITATSESEFGRVTFSPRTFVAQPGRTIAVGVATALRRSLSPGIYLLPAVVQPSPRAGSGNIRIRQQIVALLTFEIPGTTKASAVGHFLAPGNGATKLVTTADSVQFADAGHEVVRVSDTSHASFYAYLELGASQSPFGEVSFKGHTAGDPHDLRLSPQLYFPHRYRDFPVVWHASPFGIGFATLRAYVDYETSPGSVAQREVSTRVLLVSPWWVGAPWAFIAVGGLAVGRRTHRRYRARGRVETPSARRRTARVAASALALVVLALLGLLARPSVVVLASVPALVALVVFVVCDHRRPTIPKWLFVGCELLVGVLLALGAVATVLGGLQTWRADAALGVVVGAGLAAVVGWWMSWSVAPHAPHARQRYSYTGPG